MAEREKYSVAMLCRVLGVTEQGFFAWKKRGARPPPDERKLRDEIRLIHAASKRRYGSPRVYQELVYRGRGCGKHRVERLMREEGLRGKAARKFRHTTDSSHGRPVAPDLVDREFHAEAPNRVWVGDITYLWTKEGWMYLAVWVDLFSRMVVGWALGTRLKAELVTTAFARAVSRRRPGPGLIVHTDRGVQYVSDAFQKALEAARAKPSMGRTGACWDNAVAESFFHSLKVEAIYGSDIQTRREMEQEVFDYVERFYNKTRRHSTIGYCSPLRFEQTFRVEKIAA